MTIQRRKIIQVDNAYLVRQAFRYYNPSTNTFEPWNGAATVRFCTSSEDSSGVVTYTTIHDMGPFDMATSADIGTLYYVVSTGVVNTLKTAPYMGSLVYQVVEGGSNGELFDVVPLLVEPTRYAL